MEELLELRTLLINGNISDALLLVFLMQFVIVFVPDYKPKGTMPLTSSLSLLFLDSPQKDYQ